MAGVTLVTGAAGFIGFHVSRRLTGVGRPVLGADVVNAYYDPLLKEARLGVLARSPLFRFERIDLADGAAVADLFARCEPTRVIHLAAQAGVRYSLENPHAYVDSNMVGFLNILGAAGTPASSTGLRLVELGLWRQHDDAVLRPRQRRPSR